MILVDFQSGIKNLTPSVLGNLTLTPQPFLTGLEIKWSLHQWLLLVLFLWRRSATVCDFS